MKMQNKSYKSGLVKVLNYGNEVTNLLYMEAHFHHILKS